MEWGANMAIDASIYSNFKPADFVGAYADGQKMRENRMRLSDLAKQREEKASIRGLYGQHTGADGRLNKQGFLSDIAKLNPEMAMQYQDQFRKRDAEEAEARRLGVNRVGNALESLAGMSEQDRAANYGQVRNDLVKSGQISPEDAPEQYDPGLFQQTLSGWRNSDEYLGREKKQAEIAKLHADAKTDPEMRRLANEKLRAEVDKLRAESARGNNRLTEGQKVVDREFAKDYNDWTSGGAKNARSEISKLRNVVNRLEDGELSTGGLTGMLPDRITSDSVLSARADVQSTVMNSLRALLGAQFTEKEGERVIKNTWNEADSTQNNIKRLSRLVQDLEDKADDKDLKTQHYERSGTLADFSVRPRDRNSDSAVARRGERSAGGSLGISSANAAPSPPRHGTEVDGYVFMGGDPSDQKNWKRAR